MTVESNKFFAPVNCAIIKDGDGTKRHAEFVYAKDIPTEFLPDGLNSLELENKRHPWNVNGLAWDMSVNAWRNMKNAENVKSSLELFTYYNLPDKMYSCWREG
jgi:hypothetical protein